MRRLVLASISISAVARLAWAGNEPPSAAYLASRELELVAAKKPQVYLVLSPEQRALEVRARGVTLDRVSLTGLELLSQQPVFGRSLPFSPSVPAWWVIKEGPGDADREVIAPAELRPMPAEGEEEPEATPAPTPTGPTPTPTPTPEPPVSYRIQLENGWDLWITDRLPQQGFLRLVGAALRDGWNRLRGRGLDLPPAVTLVMAPEDARRIHHLFRTGAAILVTTGT
ncbi:MAG TPA: hypothetical protein PLS53_08235 [Thermoanaerobaculaceae bacterium]|nr:hypothetical protein [Thermoanaerobaculaceae bacterium]HPS78127.1 hypothetical protein [Thermoanaerobaculaceae bacterium]